MGLAGDTAAVTGPMHDCVLSTAAQYQTIRGQRETEGVHAHQTEPQKAQGIPLKRNIV